MTMGFFSLRFFGCFGLFWLASVGSSSLKHPSSRLDLVAIAHFVLSPESGRGSYQIACVVLTTKHKLSTNSKPLFRFHILAGNTCMMPSLDLIR
jgi:hypothetical protein